MARNGLRTQRVINAGIGNDGWRRLTSAQLTVAGQVTHRRGGLHALLSVAYNPLSVPRGLARTMRTRSLRHVGLKHS